LVLLLSGGYGGYWFVGQTAVERGLKSWFTERQADGWVAEYTALETVGFPSRFDTTITGLDLADPATGLAWSAPWFQVLALSYQPQHYIAVWPQDQVISNPDHKYMVHADVMKASLVFERGLAFTLDHSAMELEGFKVTRDDGQVVEIRKGVFGTRQSATIENAHDIAFDLAGYKPDLGNLRIMDPQDKLPDEIDGMKIDMTIGFDAPWNRYAIEDKRPQPTLIDLKIIKATWGELDLEIAGKLDVDGAGIPTGDITIKAKNWREILEILINMRLVPADYKSMVERGVAILGAATGDPNNLDLTLSFADGQMSIGILPLGRAPVLKIR
jgi:hypothetical protein